MLKKNIISNFIVRLLVLVTISASQNSFSQSPFIVKGEVVAPVFIASFSMLGLSYQLSQKHPLPNEAYILGLQNRNINSFDRAATYQKNNWAAPASDVLMLSSLALPLLHLSNKNSRSDFMKIAAMDAEVFALNSSLTNLIKDATHRTRPLVYNPDFSMAEKRKLDNFKSFISGHTSTVASQSFFFAYTYQAYHPHSKLNPLIWTLAAALPATTGLFRFKAGKHYWTDVIAGYAIGALVGVGVPWLHSKKIWKK